MNKTVVLSDGAPCKVRVLGLFELDGVGREPLGPYRYTVLLATGEVMEDEYDIRAVKEVPKPPDVAIEDIEEGSWEWHQLREYETYQAALAYEKERLASYENYLSDIKDYIVANCLEPDDQRRIVTVEDWEKVQAAAVVPKVTEGAIADTLRNTFQGFI